MQVQTRKTVGARELKTRLGTYLRQVQTGATLIVTDRGRPVAELRPLEGPAEEDLDARLRELIALGVVSGEVARRPPLEPFEPIESRGGSLSEAICEDREDRF
jgi:prevent-host-death family protein